MKGYRIFIILFAAAIGLYIVAEMNRPKPLDWKVTLTKGDKNPFGTYILYKQLKDIFPQATVQSYRLPVYDQLNHSDDDYSAYLLVAPEVKMSKEDVDELLYYVENGNYVFISAESISSILSDSLKFSTVPMGAFFSKDSARINFSNPALKSPADYYFRSQLIEEYFDKIDTANTIVLGTNQRKQANFIKIEHGDGAFFVHASPLCFSNYFILSRNNDAYVSNALSYIPRDVEHIYWDEYYKQGAEGERNLLRFIWSNEYLRWAYWIALFTLIIFVLFEIKRKQRIIPVIKPLRNTTLDFTETIGALYFDKHDNRNIALQKINYLMEYIRTNFYIPTSQLSDEFIDAISRKSGVSKKEVISLVNQITTVHYSPSTSDNQLLQLNETIDSFYKQVK